MHACMVMDACMHACMHASMTMHPSMHACMHGWMDAYIHTYIHPSIHPCIPDPIAPWQNFVASGPIFIIFFTVKFRKDLRRKLELKLSPPLKSVAALPCKT